MSANTSGGKAIIFMQKFLWVIFNVTSDRAQVKFCQRLCIHLWKMYQNINPWTDDEVFLTPLAEEKVQRDLDGTRANVCIFMDISEPMAMYGFERNAKLCQEK